MATAQSARQAIRTRLDAAGLTSDGSTPLPLRFPNEEADSLGDVTLSDTPSPFAYIEFVNQGSRSGPVSFGGGVGQNTYRNQGRIEGYVFVPKGEGIDRAETIAETIASLFRSYRDATISCFDASVFAGGDASALQPAGGSNAVQLGAYFYAAFEVNLFFDQIG